MRRRLLLAFVGLTAAILIGAVIPLGLTASAHDYSAYLEDAQSRARSAAAAVEELLADQRPGPDLGRALTAAGHPGDQLTILSPAGSMITRTGPPVAVPHRILHQADVSGDLVTSVAGDKVLVAVPIRSGGRTIGVVVLLRPTERLEYTLREFWLTLAVISVAALAAAVVLGIGLSRWVARPLAVLDSAARRLGDGDLTARAPAGAGPAELGRLTSTFNTMAGRLESLLRGHRAVIEDVSHQLRTPLAALRLRLDLLAPDPHDPAAAEFAGTLDEVARLSRLVDGLLAVARAENATPKAVPVPVDEVIRERLAAWTPVAAERGIELAASVPEPVVTVIGDGYLEQMLDNLIANAVDAASDGQHVSVSALAMPRGARVVVADDGPGMTAQQRDRAFHRFSTSTAGGSGLGLAIVDRLASSSGGSAELTETEGGGLTVTLNLP